MIAFVWTVIAFVWTSWLAWLKVPRIVVQVSQVHRVSAHLTVTATLTASVEVIGAGGKAIGKDSGTTGLPPSVGKGEVAPADQPAAIAQPDTFILTVVNNGSEAITIRTIGFKSDMKMRGIELDWESTAMKRREDPTATLSQPDGPYLPVRIEGHDFKIWTYEEAALEPIPLGERVLGYAKRYKMFRLPPKKKEKRDLYRRHVSETTVVRRPAPRPPD